ncbi:MULTISPECIES: secretin N-terminal domain-containing protein [unclassified Moraxella]|uniref:secretin N-terminal domain-containing protein n=1 Tax=unclassified Moraxella TaxID=2685852 RepID=UPI00359DA719
MKKLWLLCVLMLCGESLANTSQGSDRISVAFQDMPVRAVLDVLAHAGGANIVASDGVIGNMTLRLNNVPWTQALDIVVETKHLIKQEKDGVIIISSPTELAQVTQKNTLAKRQAEQYLPLDTQYIRVNYADAKNLLALITYKSDGENKEGMLSARGVANVDTRTNTLVIKDIKDNIEQIQALVERLDVPVKQVMIEARIVSANDGFSRELGVNFGVLSHGNHLQIGSSYNTL